MSNSNYAAIASAMRKIVAKHKNEIAQLVPYITGSGEYKMGYLEMNDGVPGNFIPAYPVPPNGFPANVIPIYVDIPDGVTFDPTCIPDAADEDAWDEEDEDYTEQDDDMPDEDDFEYEEGSAGDEDEYEIDGDDDGEDWANGDDDDADF